MRKTTLGKSTKSWYSLNYNVIMNECELCGFATNEVNECDEIECQNTLHCKIRTEFSKLCFEQTYMCEYSEAVQMLSENFGKAKSTIWKIVKPLTA